MKHREQDRGLTDTIPLHSQPDEPNAESLEIIREGDAFFATGESGRFGNAIDLINAALKAPEMWENSATEEAIVSEVPDRRGTYLAIFYANLYQNKPLG